MATEGEGQQTTREETLIELADVRKEYGDVTAVDDVDFTIERGEFFSLVGPSGCGKTTTLRIISGFETPTSGEVRLDGQDMRGVPPNTRDTNLVFQHLSLFPHMSVGENVGYGLKQSGVEQSERTAQVDSYLELVNLGEHADRNPTELSGGQQQRVALARALVNEPSVLLLDEPLSSLDRKLRKQMQVELRKIHEKTQGAFFYVTHDQEVAMTLSDRLAVMNEGHIEQVGAPEEIYQNPVTPFVADFIGDTNLLSGTARREDGRTRITAADGAIELTPTEQVDGGTVTISIRPEDISATTVEDGAEFEGEVVERYFQGDQTNYTVEVTDDVHLDVVTQGRDAPVERGERTRFGIAHDAPVVFQ